MSNRYYQFARNEWKNLPSPKEQPLTKEDLTKIISINDKLSIDDVYEIYLPLLQILATKIRHHKNYYDELETIIRKHQHHTFIISITGSVAVGKSTTARLLQRLLQWYYPNYKVDLITTDGFLYTSDELIKNNLMSKKGFPESYQMDKLIEALTKIKIGSTEVKIPLYSHETYDIIKDKYATINQPDILIVEGINILQNPINNQVYMNDFFDFSIYIDAEVENIKKWYLERFKSLLELAKQNPNNHYYKYALADPNEAIKIALNAWERINQPNLEQFILPTKDHSDLILHKQQNHLVDWIYLRKS